MWLIVILLDKLVGKGRVQKTVDVDILFDELVVPLIILSTTGTINKQRREVIQLK